MAIQGVESKCYILALFIRDDNERFLLGSGKYEFKDSQKQFSANTIQNDVVEVQGNDGFLLAGQVRRPGTQSFDGYVGDGTTTKEEVEAYRRDFFSFFRKNFFYRVVYVFPDGTAIQRKRGFLVDDPTVEELYQQYPEYHVALNFEDVNYYTYSENDSGEEIYAEEAQINLSSMTATGGLVWDEYGAVSEGFAWGTTTTTSGTDFTIQNELSLPTPLERVEINGEATQQTYSGKNLAPSLDEYSLGRNGSTVSFSASGNSITIVTQQRGNGVYISRTNATNMAKCPYLFQGGYTVSVTISATTSGMLRLGSEGGLIDVNVGTTPTRVSFATYSDRNVVFYQQNEDTLRYTISDIQCEAGSTATSFEPYVGGTPAPNPDYPQEIQTVTGEQTVSISDGNGNTQSYSISLGSTELCKIGDYQDYIYKNEGNWYLYKATGKIIFDGSEDENWSVRGGVSESNRFFYRYQYISGKYYEGVGIGFFCSAGIPANIGPNEIDGVGITNIGEVRIRYGSEMTLSDWKAYLGSTPMSIYYKLSTPTDTQITDTTLLAQLEALGSAKLFIGQNNILTSATSSNLPAELELTYYNSVSFDGSGYVWEEGGSGGPTIVNIDSITNIYPFWIVKGPALNPQLSVITTNTTLTYSGYIAPNQTLVIDMMNKTAKLNGTSVIGNVSGDWVNFAPGLNKVIYATTNADTPPSLIQWQEVVG